MARVEQVQHFDSSICTISVTITETRGTFLTETVSTMPASQYFFNSFSSGGSTSLRS